MPEVRTVVAEKVPDAAAHRRFLRRKYRATHAVLLYGPGHHDWPNGEFVGADNGFRCFSFLKQGTKWTHVVDVITQKKRTIENDVWKKLLRNAWLLDKKGRRVEGVK